LTAMHSCLIGLLHLHS